MAVITITFRKVATYMEKKKGHEALVVRLFNFDENRVENIVQLNVFG